MLPYHFCKETFLDTYIQLTPKERNRILRIVENVRLDPDPDDVMKIELRYLGSTYVRAYDDQDYWLLYFVHHGFLHCASCGRDSSYINLLEDLVVSNPPDPN